MRAKTRARWEQYQQIMVFLNEFLPSVKSRRRGALRLMELRVETDLKLARWYDLNADYLDNIVRRFLNLPSVQQSRRELDAEVKRVQESVRAEKDAQFGH